jgi:hypothetical protein
MNVPTLSILVDIPICASKHGIWTAWMSCCRTTCSRPAAHPVVDLVRFLRGWNEKRGAGGDNKQQPPRVAAALTHQRLRTSYAHYIPVFISMISYRVEQSK